MPATSRSGESGRTRSASGAAGSPSKSITSQPVRGAQRLARGAGRRARAGSGPGRPARPPRRRPRGSASTCSAQRGHLARRPRRAARCQRGGQLARGRARRCRAPGASSACTTATVSPSREASPAKSPPTSSARRSRLGEQVADAGQGHRPAVGGVARRSPAASPAWPARRASVPSIAPCSAATSSLPTERSARCSSRSGLTPGRHPAEQLEDGLLAAGHRGVGLLDARAPGPAARSAISAPGSGTNRTSPTVRPGPDRLQQPAGDAWVPQPVVGDQAVDPADQ